MNIDPQAFIKELRPAPGFKKNDLYHTYWLYGDQVMCRYDGVVKGGDADTFVFYLGGFAKDKNHCYFMGKRLSGANPKQFRALNNTYYKDEQFVWCVAGKVKDADAPSFVACDDGIYASNGLPIPTGFGKDNNKVFYYNFSGKACWVKKADTTSFRSMNDGIFGVDASSVFCGHSTIPKADVHSWRVVGGPYSKDLKRVFYFNKVIAGADPATFRVVPTTVMGFLFACDENRKYEAGCVVDADTWAENINLAQQCAPGDVP